MIEIIQEVYLHFVVLILGLLLDRQLLQCGIDVQLVGLQLP